MENQIVLTIIASLIASGTLTGALIWLTREWISARLKSSIQHEYNQKLETYKAQLQAQNEIALIEFKNMIERESALRDVAHSSFAEGQKASMERKLSAVDKLWERIITLRNGLPPILMFIDILTVEEYKSSNLSGIDWKFITR
jgi:hypothetical protein